MPPVLDSSSLEAASTPHLIGSDSSKHSTMKRLGRIS